MSFHNKTFILLTAIFILFITFGLIFFYPYYFPKPIKKVIASISNRLTGGHNHLLNCDELPNINTVRNLVFEKKDKLLEIVYDGNAEGLSRDSYYNFITSYDGDNYSLLTCPDKADLLITVETSEESNKLKNKFGDNFYSIPYRIILT